MSATAHSDIEFIDEEYSFALDIHPGWYLQNDTSLYLPQNHPFESEKDALNYLEELKLQEQYKIAEEKLLLEEEKKAL